MSPCIAYTEQKLGAASLAVVDQANAICRDYRRQGFDLTLRQLYYQFVATGLIPNRDTEYKRLGSIINDARMAGLLDWDYIVDRTRNVAGGDGWMTDPAEVIEPGVYSMALWQGQPNRVEAWVEKDALVGILERAASDLRLPYFACRGYTSQSEAWRAAQRIEGYLDEDGVDRVVILHLGDHDPSGIDMTRDITDRLTLFLDGDGYDSSQLWIHRLALNMDQVEQYGPPPNPAKITDSRAGRYIARYGRESWELDALNPTILSALVRDNALELVDLDLWHERQEEEREGRKVLTGIKTRYVEIAKYLEDHPE
jgi:hypothetical protein